MYLVFILVLSLRTVNTILPRENELEDVIDSQVSVNDDAQYNENHAPEISVEFMSNDGSGQSITRISEYAIAGDLVAVMKVQDRDTGDNGLVACSIYNKYIKLSKLTHMYYKLFVFSELDRERKSSINVTVTCTDHGNPPMTGSASFLIVVIDENDNPPRFYQDYYRFKLNENNPLGLSLITITATDIDVGKNAEITYEISTFSNHGFSVDPTTGLIRTSSSFDRETTPVVAFEVVARDNGIPSLESKASIIVDILDDNDNKPEFDKTIYYFYVSDSISNGTAVGSVSATDPDQGKNGQITYTLDNSIGIQSVPFTVLPSGQIITIGTFDREQVPLYEFTVLAVDNGSPSLTSSANVQVTVTQ